MSAILNTMAAFVSCFITLILQMFAEKMNIKVRSKRSVELFDEFMRSWLPLNHACLRASVQGMSPRMSFSHPGRLSSFSLSESHRLFSPVKACSSDGVTIIYIAKILRYGESVLAMVRLLSGTVKKDDRLYLINERKTPYTEDVQR